MEELKELGIYMNNEPGDKEALAFAGLLSSLTRPDSIHCIHVR